MTLTPNERDRLRAVCDDGRQFDEVAHEVRAIVAARLAGVRALADRWQDVLDECKAADPRWILDRSVTTLETALNDLRRAVVDGQAVMDGPSLGDYWPAPAHEDHIRALTDIGVHEQWTPDEWRAAIIRAVVDGQTPAHAEEQA